MKKGLLILMATALPFFIRTQYISMGGGVVPTSKETGVRLSLNMTAGVLFGKKQVSPFVEGNMVVALTPLITAPNLFQLRVGPSVKMDRCLTMRPFAGLSITTRQTDRSRTVGYGVNAGCYLIQDVGGDFKIKYELSISNQAIIVPSIAAFLTF
jgi:hypothetical protein